MLCALIMAGGKGTRFWPLSTEDKPKQFLKLVSEETMLQMTVRRLEKLIPIEKIFVVTGSKYVPLVEEQLSTLPHSNIIVEPVGKNTAPCIALSAFYINSIYEDATIAVIPSDHLITDENRFLDTLQSGFNFISENSDAIITVGIKPTRPETGYGYIECLKTSINNSFCEIRRVQKFVEKPNLEHAKEYLQDGGYLWNAGIFIWKSSNILRLTSMYLQNTYNILSEIAAANDDEYEKVLEVKYNELDSISVDYGIMEKVDNIYVIPAEFGWDDIGSWNSVRRYGKKDNCDNVLMGDIKIIGSQNNIVITEQSKVVLVGVSGLYIIEKDGVIYVVDENEISSINEIKDKVI